MNQSATTFSGHARTRSAAVLLVALSAPALAAPRPNESFWNGDERVELASATAELGVLVDESWSSDDVWSLLATVPEIDLDATPRAYVPGHIVRAAVRADASRSDALAAAERLATKAGVRVAAPGLLTAGGANPLFATDEVLVLWRPSTPNATVASLEAEHGLERRQAIELAAGTAWIYRLGAGDALRSVRVARELAESEQARLALPNLVLTREAYDCTPPDPLFPNQWNLEDANVPAAASGSDLFVPEIWDSPINPGSDCFDLGDPNLTVAVIDSGFDLDHEDLFDNYLKDGAGNTIGYNAWAPGTPPDAGSPPFQVDKHGTNVAGVVSAVFNETGLVGVAPGCKLLPIKLISEALPGQWTVGMEVDCFTQARLLGADVVNCSWGPSPAFAPPFLPASTKLALDELAQLGRGGLGCVTVFAVGNTPVDVTPNYYGSYTNVIGVGASNSLATIADYSGIGMPVDLVAPGGGGGGLGITTTNVAPKYVSNFSGTSAAAPAVAGVALLLLSQNPGLHWREVKEILEDTADKIDEMNAGYDQDTGHSAMGFGYGKVNAQAALTDPVDGPAKYATPAGVERYGWGTPGTTGVPLIECPTPTDGDLSFEVSVREANPNSLGLFLLGFSPFSQLVGVSSFGNAITVQLSSLVLNPAPTVLTNTDGEVSYPVPLLPGSAGITIYAQFLIEDPGTPTQGLPAGGNAASRGLRITIQP
ncbi:MAG: S8 family serine peptidase [Planctomycetota bacterium]